MEKTKNEIVVYQPDETIRLEVRLENDTVWIKRHQMAELFGRDIKTIGKHIANALSEELSDATMHSNVGRKDMTSTVTKLETVEEQRFPVVAKFATTAADGKVYQVEYYNLDVVLSVGYRVKSIQGIKFRRWANAVLKDYLLRGYALNQRMNQLEDKVDRRLAEHDGRISSLEEKVDFFVRTSLPPVQGVFYDGQVFDARVFATRHILSAKESIFLIDNWVDVVTLEILSKKAADVAVEIVTSRRGNRLSMGDITDFNEQYGGLLVRESANFHDRFLVIDDRTLYLVGASLKDLGRKCFAFTQLDSSEIPRLKSRI
ncbi:MAG: virulence RhuM family protein [Lentisphaeria bacterium]|nr:virulence RhuM family protein [Lentisphaeria bacterium]